MSNLLNFKSTLKLLNNIVFLFLLFTFLFGRSFMGLYILNFRIGELLVGVCLISSILFLLNHKENKLFLSKELLVTQVIIWFSFLLSLFINRGSLFTEYTYKSSSYIWAISAIYLGIIFFKNFQFDKKRIAILQLALVYVYILSTVNYPEFLINFFLEHSDKWDFNKASTIGIVFIITMLVNNSKITSNKLNSDYFVLISFLFLPLFLYKSRGAFIGISIFVISQTIIYRKKIFKNEFRTYLVFFLAVVLALLSSYRVLDQNIEELVEEEQLFSLFYSSQAVEKLAGQKDTKVENFISFYTRDGRLYSVDGNINWRMQIWQDVIFDSNKLGTQIFGVGYSEKIPAMNKFERAGRDGLNENVHNFLFNIYARGGIVQIILFTVFYFYLYVLNGREKNYNNLIWFAIPIFIISFFDTSMENAHFPFLFYFFTSYFLIYNKDLS